MGLKIVAVLCVRNESPHLPRLLEDFSAQGIDVAAIDHDSDDGSRQLLQSRLGRGVVALEDLPWRGEFDLGEQLEAKLALIGRLGHDWVIHADADEWLHSPRAGESLREGIERHDRAGCTAVNFEEFVFLPGAGQEVRDCQRELRHYYHFAPGPHRLMRAWKRSAGLSNTDSGGHQLSGEHLLVAPEPFVLRHYIALSQQHALRKYAARVFSRRDLERGWHHNRLGLDVSRLRFPDATRLQSLPSWDSVEFDRSQPRASHYWDWPPEPGEVDLLACIYTCEAHRGLLERFHESEVGILLRNSPRTRILEVYADPGATQSHVDGDRLVLKANESYLDLPVKTHRMIDFCVDNFRFRNMLKIDITSVLTQLELDAPEYSERNAMDMSAIAEFLRQADYGQDYSGFVLHERAEKEGAENWARKKGIAIDYARFFGDGPMPSFYSGKCYLLSRRFAEFIARFGADLAAEHCRYFPGAEDVMVGRMHERFQAAPSP